MKKNKLDDEILNFIRPVYRGKAKKGILMFIGLINIGGSIIIWDEYKSKFSFSLILIGIFFAFVGCFILSSEKVWIQKAIYGFCETLFLLVLSYCATYMEYKGKGYNIATYVSITQLIGACIFIIFFLILLYRLKKPTKDKDADEMVRSIKWGFIIGGGIFLFVFGGLFLLYYFKQNIHLIDSSKMLYVAMVLNALTAYYTLKVCCCIKYHSEIKQAETKSRE